MQISSNGERMKTLEKKDLNLNFMFFLLIKVMKKGERYKN